MLQLLHIFWFSTIVTMIIKFVKGEMEKDERSDDEFEDDGKDDWIASPMRNVGESSETN